MAEKITEDMQQRLALDTLDAAEIVRILNEEDRTVADAVARATDDIAAGVELLINSWKQGGRWVYVGAGTSGRIAAMDAAECPPTFGVKLEQVVAVVAGGAPALGTGVEGAEDDAEAAGRDLRFIELSERDVVVGIAASGSTPYTVEALRYASSIGCSTVGISNNPDTELSRVATVGIELVTGPEVLAGSTRLKAGTAQKMAMNMLSTAAFCKLGKVYGNLMVDMKPTNVKLRRRAERIVASATNLPDEEAAKLLREAGTIKSAIVTGAANVSPEEATDALSASEGDVRTALERLRAT